MMFINIFKLKFENHKKELFAYIKEKKIFFKFRKKTEESTYKYKIHDPNNIFVKQVFYEKLFLVGSNWRTHPAKPICIVLGCNNWKHGIIAEYMKDHRVVFAQRKNVGMRMVLTLPFLYPQPNQIAIWGYNESKILSLYLKYRGKKIWRLEDGFVRSVSLGASHSIPYSLVIDKYGLYYNYKDKSGIEEIISNCDLKEKKITIIANHLINLIIESRITKYNEVPVRKNIQLKTKKIVLVLGQVSKDKSVLFGNPNKWTTEELIQLAYYENPEADIWYRPHPEVYKKFQKNNLRYKRVQEFCTILSPEESLSDLIEKIDHAYTITSLSGFEALLRGKKVTVVGVPFYAGWGLTDDRVLIDTRQRKLTLTELFIASYLLYPKYLVDLDNSINGLKITISKIKAERNYQLINQFYYPENQSYFFQKRISSISIKNLIKNNLAIEASTVYKIFKSYKNKELDYTLLNLLWGITKNDNQKLILIKSIIPIIEEETLLRFLNELIIHYNDDVVDYFLILSLIKVENYEEAENYINKILNTHKDNAIVKSNALSDMHTDTSSNVEGADGSTFLDDKYLVESLEYKLKVQLEKADYKSTINNLNLLLKFSNGDVSFITKYLNILIDVLYNTFDFHLAEILCEISAVLDFSAENRYAYKKLVELNFINNNYSLANIDTALLLMISNPDQISTLLKYYERDSSEQELLIRTLYMENNQTINKAIAFIEIGDINKAFEIFDNLVKTGTNLKILKLYTDLLSASNKIDEAISLLESNKNNLFEEAVLKNLIRLHCFKGNFTAAMIYANIILEGKYEINLTYLLPTYLGLGEIEKGYSLYIKDNFTKTLSLFFKEKFREINTPSDIKFLDKTIIIAMYGPGDEIRFASIYSEIAGKFSEKKFIITCDYRLYEIFSRSFPNITFLPIKRTRTLNSNYPSIYYNKLPSIELITILDNSSIDYINNYQYIYLATDYISFFRKKYSDFHGKSYLNPKQELVESIAKSLPKNKILIGLNWRSSLTNASRIEHYFSVEQMVPILEVENVQFVNLQYDVCHTELEWIHKHYPGKIINPDINQFFDFESVAALMLNLDLIIAPPTSVLELAGALGCKAFLFANSGEILWRKINDDGIDVWHNSITIIDVQEKGNKVDLANKVALATKEFIYNYDKKK